MVKVISFIHLLSTVRSKFMYLGERALLQIRHPSSLSNLRESSQMLALKREKSPCGELRDPLVLQGRKGWDATFQVRSHLFPKYLKGQIKMCLDIMGQYSTTLHIYLYFKYSMFTVHKVSFSKAVAIATNQGNHSNNTVLCTALIRD